jgi:hypothetical protein
VVLDLLTVCYNVGKAMRLCIFSLVGRLIWIRAEASGDEAWVTSKTSAGDVADPPAPKTAHWISTLHNAMVMVKTSVATAGETPLKGVGVTLCLLFWSSPRRLGLVARRGLQLGGIPFSNSACTLLFANLVRVD